MTREELITATEENAESVFELLAQYTPQARFRRDKFMRRMNFGVPASFFNGVAMAHLTRNNCDEKIEEAIEEMTRNGLPWSWQIAPSSTPHDLADRLIEHDMKHAYDMPIMAMDLSSWQPNPGPENYRSLFVSDSELYGNFTEVAQEAFGLPDVVMNVFVQAQNEIGFAEDVPIRNFIGIANGETVCTGTVYYGHGVAGIYTIGTPAEYRGQGYGTAITGACMADAKARGYDMAFLQASKMGYKVYEKIGFEPICKLSIYVPAEA